MSYQRYPGEPGYTAQNYAYQIQRLQIYQQMKNYFVDDEKPISITDHMVGAVIFGRLFTSEKYMFSDENHPCAGHIVDITIHPSVLGFAHDLAHIQTMRSLDHNFEPQVETVIRCKKHKKSIKTTSDKLFNYIEPYDPHSSHLKQGETYMTTDGRMVKPNEI